MDFVACLFLALIGSFFFAITANEYREFFSKISTAQDQDMVVPFAKGKQAKARSNAA